MYRDEVVIGKFDLYGCVFRFVKDWFLFVVFLLIV